MDGIAGPGGDRGACAWAGVAVALELQLPEEPSAIVSIPTPAAEEIRQAGIRASIRAGAVRVGFHLYNTEDDLDRLLDVLR